MSGPSAIHASSCCRRPHRRTLPSHGRSGCAGSESCAKGVKSRRRTTRKA
jgi:hypothetical protein